MPSIKFDTTEIVTGTYIPRYIKHESIPERFVTLSPLAREDGSAFVAEKYGVKHIIVAGNIKANTQTTLENNIDSFKELFSRKERNLDISWASGTRRYEATCIRHEFNRDYMHINFVPWVAEFVVPSGVGEETGETHLVNTGTFSNTSEHTDIATFSGTARPKPRIRIKSGSVAGIIKGIMLKNVDTGEKIVYTNDSLDGAKYFQVDARTKEVTYDGVACAFYGVIPSWVVGANNYAMKCGKILDQEFDGTPIAQASLYGAIQVAMSFTVPNTDDTYQAVEINLSKQGSPANLVGEIHTDNNGEPSGSMVAGTQLIWLPANVPTGLGNEGWVSDYTGATFELSANTRYWLVLYQLGAGGDVANRYFMATVDGVNATYKRGNVATSADSGVSWADDPTRDLLFRLFYGGKEEVSTSNYDIYYYKRYL